MATVTIVGAGMMGSATAWPLSDNGHTVRLVGTHLDTAIITLDWEIYREFPARPAHVFNDVFIKMWEKLPRYQIGKTPICGWLYRIAHNAVVDHYRTRKLSVSLDDVNSAEVRHDDGTEEKLELQVKLDQLRMALQNLTDGQREVLILRFIEGLSVEKVARQLRKSHGAVRALQMRGLQELSKAPTLRTDR